MAEPMNDPSAPEQPKDVIEETETSRKLRILKNFVKTTKRRNQRFQQQSTEPNRIGVLPLFTEFLSIDYKQQGEKSVELEGKKHPVEALSFDEHDEDESNRAPRRMIIDVDVELGLKPRTSVFAAKGSSRKHTTEQVVSKQKYMADESVSSNNVSTNFLSPKEEGYYEGKMSIAMPEDKLYLSELQCWVRQNLEIFSATTQDIALSSYGGGRRASVVLGKIGVRCVHCAAVAVQSLSAGSESKQRFVWPTAALSYPFNLNGLYTACTQKPHLHFNHCPYLPPEEKDRLKALTQIAADRPTKRARNGVPGAMYYVVAAKRIGLLEVEDGMRFGRDLSLEPLPFETILVQVQDERKETTATDTSNELTTEPVLSAPSSQDGPDQTTRLHGDEASEQVLAEAVAEPDDGYKLLARSRDKSMVSDYIFLTIRQMAICNAVPIDFSTRGKKTKLMRVGFAGFCCRHCDSLRGPSITDYSCRSFCSAPDNLSSAISNSFATHLTKCTHVPNRIKKALIAYRRIHQRQMAQLPYGSQRRLFRELWERLRAADKSEEDMEPIIATMKSPPLATSVDPYANVKTSDLETTTVLTTAVSSEQSTQQVERGDGFPVSNEPETVAVLRSFIDNWDPKTNDCLIVPEDKNLVSDYVFLTMRQLKVALPTSSDAVRIRRGVPVNPNFPGICCIHCADQPNPVIPSGRSFPSAPDNFASALNTSLYNHMQSCPYIPENLKRVLADVRKLHSSQCANIKFGSQRRYFNRLYDRLQRFQNAEGERGSSGRVHRDASAELEEAGFLQLPSKESSTLFVCKRCNMVPIHFRAPRSVFTERPSVARAREHQSQCSGSKLDLTMAVETFRAAAASIQKDPIEMISSEKFISLIQHAMGNDDDLFKALHQGILAILENEKEANKCTERADLWRSFGSLETNTNNFKKAFAEFTSELDSASSDAQDYSEVLAFLMLVGPSLGLEDTRCLDATTEDTTHQEPSLTTSKVGEVM